MSESPELKDNPFGGLGTLMAPLIVDRWVDSLVTADGVAEMIRAGRVNNPQIDPEPPPAENDHKPTSTLTDFRYLSLDEFLVSVKEAESDPDPLKLSFERRGLVSWKLVRIDLPMPDEKKTAGPE